MENPSHHFCHRKRCGSSPTPLLKPYLRLERKLERRRESLESWGFLLWLWGAPLECEIFESAISISSYKQKVLEGVQWLYLGTHYTVGEVGFQMESCLLDSWNNNPEISLLIGELLSKVFKALSMYYIPWKWTSNNCTLSILVIKLLGDFLTAVLCFEGFRIPNDQKLSSTIKLLLLQTLDRIFLTYMFFPSWRNQLANGEFSVSWW